MGVTGVLSSLCLGGYLVGWWISGFSLSLGARISAEGWIVGMDTGGSQGCVGSSLVLWVLVVSLKSDKLRVCDSGRRSFCWAVGGSIGKRAVSSCLVLEMSRPRPNA